MIRYFIFLISMALLVFDAGNCMAVNIPMGTIQQASAPVSDIKLAAVTPAATISTHRELILRSAVGKVSLNADSEQMLSFRPTTPWGYTGVASNAEDIKAGKSSSEVIHLLPLFSHMKVVARCQNKQGESYSLPMMLKTVIWQDKHGKQYKTGDTVVLHNSDASDALKIYSTQWSVPSSLNLVAGNYQCSVPEKTAMYQIRQSSDMTKEGVGNAGIEITPFQVYVQPSLKVSVESAKTVLNLLPQNNYTDTAMMNIVSNTAKIAIAYKCDSGSFNETMCALKSQSQSQVQKKLPVAVGISGESNSVALLPYSVGLTNSYLAGAKNHYYTTGVTPNSPNQTRLKLHIPPSSIAHATPGNYTGQITVYIYAVPHDNFST